MVDAPAWGQDWKNIMRDSAATVAAADPDANTLFSIHMYGVYNTASSITTYLDAFKAKGLPLIIGEFGYRSSSADVDDATVMAEAVKRNIGYYGWSWSGNTDPVLDMVIGFNPAQPVAVGPEGAQRRQRHQVDGRDRQDLRRRPADDTRTDHPDADATPTPTHADPDRRPRPRRRRRPRRPPTRRRRQGLHRGARREQHAGPAATRPP